MQTQMHGVGFGIIYRDNNHNVECDSIDYTTYFLGKLLYKNNNLTLEKVFAKLSLEG